MNILVIYAEDYPWDVRVEKISLSLASAGHAVTVLSRNLERRPSREVLGELECLRVTSPGTPRLVNGPLSLPAFFSPVWSRRLDQAITSQRTDLIIVRDLPLAPLAISTGKRRGIPVVVDMAENHPAMWSDVAADSRFRLVSLLIKNPALARRMERWVASRADAILVVVDEMKDHLVRVGAQPEIVTIVSNTPDLTKFDAPGAGVPGTSDADQEAIDLVYVGFINMFRGLQHVIRAMGLLRDRMPQLRLIVAGDGEGIEELESLAVAEGLGERVEFRGWLPHAQVPDLIRRSDIGVIPHRRTGHTDTTVPNKIFDYMACGLPVLVSDARPLARIARDFGCGLAFESGNPADLAERLLEMQDPAVRQAMGERGRAAVIERFHWQQDKDLLLQTILRLGR